tara:strand:- start:8552 stop:9505 length:954 start_codon:yes stop_codon:yes gene_type:complete
LKQYKVGAYYGGFGASLLGSQWAGFDPLYLCEPRKEFDAGSITVNFPDIKVNTSPDEALSNMDLVWGSPPCAQFSSLGVKRKDHSKLDTLNPYDFDYSKFLISMLDHRVDTFVLENVPRVLNYFNFTDDGFVTFCGRRVINMPDYEFQIVKLNANECGVPQKRNRVYVIGSRVFKPNFNIKKYLPIDSHYVGEVVKDVLPIDHVQSELPRHSEMRRKGFSGLEPGQSYYGTQNNRRLFWDRPSYTITSHCTRHVHPEESRVLSVKECAKIMGYPDDYKFTGNESRKLDQIGKAIVPQVAYLISNYIKDELQRTNRKG